MQLRHPLPGNPAGIVRYSDDESDDRDYAGDENVSESSEVAAVPAEADPDPLGRGRRRAGREARRTGPSANAGTSVNDVTSMTVDTLAQAFLQATHGQGGDEGGRGGATSIAKSASPKWESKTESFHTFKRKVMIWTETHNMDHRLSQCPRRSQHEFKKHDVARREC